jgi:Domain of unknown function (DUF5916)/Carbohydrate family 9 binding domain-like
MNFFKLGGFLLFPCVVFSQSLQETHVLNALRTPSPIKIDGVLDDAIWNKAEAIGDFWEKYPNDKNKAKLNTQVKAAYDDKYVYFGIFCQDSIDRYVAPSLKRDGTIRETDGVMVVLDPVNKKSNGFSFSTTPFNVQTEYQVAGSSFGGEINAAWDNKWISAVKRTGNGYFVEFAIPYKTLRYNPQNTDWGVNFVRSDQKNYKFYSWTNIPVQFPGFDLGYLGKLHFDGNLPETKGNVSLIPYISGSVSGDNEAGTDVKGKFKAGFDAKVALTPSINMDLTLFPDFSQVDVDQQVTNLTRFSVFFPERRTFFLENDDLFSSYGAPPFRPFFSRRIGLDKDNNPIPIVFGSRISGNLNKSLRIGAFNMQTGRKGDFGGQNYSAISLIQRIGKRSAIKGYALNRVGQMSIMEEKANPLAKFGRNEGVEMSLSDASGKLTAWGGLHFSQKPGIEKNTNFFQLGAGYFGKSANVFVDYGEVGQNYYADMGFVNRSETLSTIGSTYESGDTTYRVGFKQVYNENTYNIRPKDGWIVTHTFTFSNYLNWFQDGKLSDRASDLIYMAFFKNSSTLKLNLGIMQDNLKYFFPLPSDKPLIPGTYNYNNFSVVYKSDNRKNVLFTTSVKAGQYYNAKLQQYSAQISVKKQPYWTLSMLAEYNDIKFPKEYGRTKLLLVSPKTEVNFSNRMFWTTFYQFNTQANNFNINSRLQFRYSPMSDLFLVYTDNYYTDPLFKNKNRAIVFKLNYWLTV